MKILQVKQYHNLIADRKYKEACNRWEKMENRNSFPILSMYYFMIEDNKGYPLKKRLKGYIAFDETRTVFGATPEEAETNFVNAEGR